MIVGSKGSPLGLLLLLRSLHAVLATTLLAIRYAAGIESTADDVVAHTGEILHTTTTHEHDGVLLEVVTLTGDIAIDLPAIRQTDTCHPGSYPSPGGSCDHYGLAVELLASCFNIKPIIDTSPAITHLTGVTARLFLACNGAHPTASECKGTKYLPLLQVSQALTRRPTRGDAFELYIEEVIIPVSLCNPVD